MAASPRKRFALDTNVVLDLGAGDDYANEFRELARFHGYSLHLPPTVIGQLDFIASEDGSVRSRFAQEALDKIPEWGFGLASRSEIGTDIAERFAHELIVRQLLPLEEVADGWILAETALSEIPVLVTSDHHFLDMDDNLLLQAFQDADLAAVRPAHPKGLLRALRLIANR